MSTVAARLEARAAAVAESSSSTKVDNATIGSSNHAESNLFLQQFEETKRTLENELSQLATAKEASIKAGTQDQTLEGLKAELAKLTGSLVSLQQLTASSAHLLTPYDLRSTKIQLGQLEESIQRMSDMIAPKKKFAFRKKTTPMGSGASSGGSVGTNQANIVAPLAPTASVSSTVIEQLPPEDPATGFYRKSDLVLVKHGSVTDKDVMLSHLTNCVVFILDHPSALRCHNLVNCHVYVGPCSGSVLIYGAVDCTFHMSQRQLRIHDTHRTTFHLNALSSPIIEHTDTTGFAALDFDYPQMQSDLVASGFEGKPSRHSTVEDFNWLRSQQSPNWYVILPEQTKRPPVTLNQDQVAQLADMNQENGIDQEQQQQLKSLVRQLKIVQ